MTVNWITPGITVGWNQTVPAQGQVSTKISRNTGTHTLMNLSIRLLEHFMNDSLNKNGTAHPSKLSELSCHTQLIKIMAGWIYV